MKRVLIIESIKGVKVNCHPNAYKEKFIVGRYTVKALLFPNGDYFFYVFRDDVLKAIISKEEWFISRMDGECQNLLNRLLAVYG